METENEGREFRIKQLEVGADNEIKLKQIVLQNDPSHPTSTDGEPFGLSKPIRLILPSLNMRS